MDSSKHKNISNLPLSNQIAPNKLNLNYLLGVGNFIHSACYCRKLCDETIWIDNRKDCYSILKEALKDEQNTIPKDDLNIALLYAAYSGNLECIHLLLDSGADVTAVDGNFNNAVMLAVTMGRYYKDTSDAGTSDHKYKYEDVVRVLIQHGCPPNEVNVYHKTPLIAACEFVHTEMVKLLLEYIDFKDSDRSTPLREADLMANLNLPRLCSESRKIWHRRTTPLIVAVMRENRELVKVLLDAKVPIDEGDFEGSTALHYAVVYYCPYFVELLLDAGADVNSVNLSMVSPLMKACRSKDEDVMLILLRRGAKVTVPQASNRNSLGWPFYSCVLSDAAKFAPKDVMDALCEAADDLDHEACLFSPLSDAVAAKNIVAAKCLIYYGCSLDTHSNVRLLGKGQKTLLQISIEEKNLDVIRLLYEAGAFTCKSLYECYKDMIIRKDCLGNPELMEMLEMFACNPPSLIHICRKTVREAIQKPLPRTVPCLGLPRPVKGFLLYNDI